MLSRLTTAVALATALVAPAALVATPAHAASFTAVYNTGTGFGTQVLSANRGDVITITNATPLTVAFAPSWGVTPQTAAPNGGTVSFTLTTVDSGAVTAAGPGVQNVLAVL
jgi:hypothetical protein